MSEEHIRRAVEMITGDMSLTDDVADSEGIRLLNWGTGVARLLALHSVDMEPDAAVAYLDEHIPNLRRVMRRVNKLVGSLQSAAPDDIADRLGQVFAAAQAVPGLNAQPISDFLSLAQAFQTATPADVLNSILSQLNGE